MHRVLRPAGFVVAMKGGCERGLERDMREARFEIRAIGKDLTVGKRLNV